jgi:uncharacterized repeat protein (TIGR03847 family)
MLDDLAQKDADRLTTKEVDISRMNMELREPIDPEFRVSQLGLGYDDDRDMIVMVAREMVMVDGEGEGDPELTSAGVARFWTTRQQMRALSQHANDIVKQGRVDPQSNGRLLYYWT